MSVYKLDNKIIELILNNDRVFEGKVSKELINGDISQEDFDYIINNPYEKDNYINGFYDNNDLVLVRTTDRFPNNDGVLRTVANSLCFDNCDNFFEIDEENPIYSMYRSSMHFTLNGLVANHSLGNFSGRDLIVFDLLDSHINDDILSINVADTYFKGDFCLSNNSFLCMSQSTYDEIIKDEKYSEFVLNSNIFIYDLNDYFKKYEEINETKFYGSFESFLENAICKYCLILMGKPCFSLSSSYYVRYNFDDNVTSMTKFVSSYSNIHGISSIAHFTSSFRDEDAKIMEDNSLSSSIEHYKYIVTHCDAPLEIKDKMISYIPYIECSSPYDLKSNNRHSYVNKNSKEIEKLRDIYFDLDENSPQAISILEELKILRKDGNLSVDQFIKDRDLFIETIGIQQYILLTKEYNEIYKKNREKEIELLEENNRVKI